MLKIYHMPHARGSRVVWTAEELGLPHEVVIKGRGRLKLPDFLAVNPLGSAPAIQDSDVTMKESVAIVQYLLERYYKDHRLSPPNDDPARAA